MLVAISSLVGLAVFFYPFLLPAINQTSSDNARTSEAPMVLAGLMALCLGAILLELDPAHNPEGSARTVAILAALVALGAVSRLIPSFMGATPIFLLVILGGYVFGPAFGFQLGALTLALSAFITGGIGPWVPYQMLGVGWVGMGAGFLPGAQTERTNRTALVLYGIISGLVFGALLNLWFWPFAAPGGEVAGNLSWSPEMSVGQTLDRYLHFYVITSLWFDLFRSAANAILIVLLGPSIIATLTRYRRRTTWTDWEPVSARM